MSDAQSYLHHRSEANKAFKAGDGALCAGHSAAAHSALVRYAATHGINTDEACARIRRAEYLGR